jgi:glutamate formiminotransferase
LRFPLIECIPNVSEGRRPAVIEALVRAVAAVEGVYVLDYSSDPDHNRSVITMVGAPEPLEEAVMALFRGAAATIDMSLHRGAHPRIGAVDVVPFVPLYGASMADAVVLARRVGERVGRELEVPVYLYEEAARHPERRSLPAVRRGQLEALREQITHPERLPDFGPPRVHPTLGATAVGARRPLIAFNAVLDTSDLEIAQSIARRVRESGGGLRYLRAIGVYLEHSRRCQISMNLLDPERTALYTALEAVRTEARRYGVRVLSTEIVGLAPCAALLEAARYYLQLQGFPDQRVLEMRMLEILLRERETTPAPPVPAPPARAPVEPSAGPGPGLPETTPESEMLRHPPEGAGALEVSEATGPTSWEEARPPSAPPPPVEAPVQAVVAPPAPAEQGIQGAEQSPASEPPEASMNWSFPGP